jgi:hypothetical protein
MFASGISITRAAMLEFQPSFPNLRRFNPRHRSPGTLGKFNSPSN